jgi:hypothetical protein
MINQSILGKVKENEFNNIKIKKKEENKKFTLEQVMKAQTKTI